MVYIREKTKATWTWAALASGFIFALIGFGIILYDNTAATILYGEFFVFMWFVLMFISLYIVYPKRFKF